MHDIARAFRLTDSVQAYWEGWFSESHSHSLIAQPFYSATIFGNPGNAQRARCISA